MSVPTLQDFHAATFGQFIGMPKRLYAAKIMATFGHLPEARAYAQALRASEKPVPPHVEALLLRSETRIHRQGLHHLDERLATATIDAPDGTTTAESFAPPVADDDGEYIAPEILRERTALLREAADRQQHHSILAGWRERVEANPRIARTAVHEAGHVATGFAAGFTVGGAKVNHDGSGFARVSTKSNPMAHVNATSWVDGGGAAAEVIAFGETEWRLQLGMTDSGGKCDGESFIGGAKELRETERHLLKHWTRTLRIANELFDNVGTEISAARLAELWRITPPGDAVMID